jgi:predicted DNA-binding transcriptional regulator AlpA
MQKKYECPIESILIDANAAASALGVCSKTVWTLTKNNDLPCVRIGQRVLYDPRDLRTWVDRQKTTAENQNTSQD